MIGDCHWVLHFLGSLSNLPWAGAVVGAAARSARWTLALWLLQSPELLADPNVTWQLGSWDRLRF